MKKRYFDKEAFITFINLLEENRPVKLFTESKEDGSIEEYLFMKMEFNGNTITLYSTPYLTVNIIQDTPVSPWVDYAELVFEDLNYDGEYRLFIESN